MWERDICRWSGNNLFKHGLLLFFLLDLIGVRDTLCAILFVARNMKPSLLKFQDCFVTDTLLVSHQLLLLSGS